MIDRIPATVRWVLAAILCLASTAHAQASPPIPDPYARIIDRADAVVLGRVLEAGVRYVPDDPHADVNQGFVRVAVERWIVGPDTDQTLEVKLSPHDHFLLEDLRNSVSQSDRRVILYMARSIGKWWLVREVGGDLGRPSDGIEILSTSEALHRIPAISREAEVASPDSLAAQADIVIVGSLGRHTSHAPSVTCRVERVVSGTMTDSTLTVVTERRMDLHEGRALLMLKAEPDGTWRVLNDGAGCYFLDRDRTAHYATSPEAVFARLADARARRVGRDGRR